MVLNVNRRRFVSGVGGFVAAASGQTPFFRTPVSAPSIDRLTIDLPAAPESIVPALAYSANDWSIVHSIYDALVGIDEQGTVQPLAAASFTSDDATTWSVTLREGMTFHDGSAVDVSAIVRGFEHVQSDESLVSDTFAVVTDIRVTGDLTADIVCSTAAPWLPSQMAVWHLLLPDGFSIDEARTKPVGSGPFQFVSQQDAESIELARFDQWIPAPVKGTPIADTVVYRFVTDATTRLADVTSGTAQLAADISLDAARGIEQPIQSVESSIVGSAWLRIPNDITPFDDVRVRQALNLAMDVEAIAQAFSGSGSHRLASLAPDNRAMGFDPDLAAYDHDPDQARSLLEAAGMVDGFDTRFEVTTAADDDVVDAIVAQWADAGIRAEVVTSDYAAFNAKWNDASAPPIKLVTWSPLYDPNTLLSLVWTKNGYLSRYRDEELDRLIREAGAEPDVATRSARYRDVYARMNAEAAAGFLWNLVKRYATTEEVAAAWTPRGDEWVLPLGAG